MEGLTMGNSFKTFWKDYNDMCVKPQCEWMKKHWKGYSLVLIGSFVGGYAVGYVIDNKDEIEDKVKSIFKKKEEA